MGSSNLKFEYLGDIGKLVFRGGKGKTSVDFSGLDLALLVNDTILLKADSKKVFIPHLKASIISDVGGQIQVGDLKIVDGGLSTNNNIVEKISTFEISSEQLVGSEPGSVGHPGGAVLVECPGEDYVLQLISAVLIYNFKNKPYVKGDDDVVIKSGNSEISGPTAAQDLIGATENKILLVTPLAAFGAPLEQGKDLTLCGTPYDNPWKGEGNLTGYITYKIIRLSS